MALKILGGFLLALSGFSTGCMFSKKLVSRRNFFKSIIRFISALSTQIRYNTADIFTLASIAAETAELEFFDVSDKRGRPFYSVWSEKISLIPSRYGLNSGDKRLLLELGEQLGKTDVEGQLKHLELYETVFKKQLSDSENDVIKKSKLYKTMGFFVGTAAALMMI